MRITFKVIPTLGLEKDNKFLVKENNSFLTFEPKGSKYDSFIKYKLKELFYTKFYLSRTLLALDTKAGINIYIFVIPSQPIDFEGFNWLTKDELDPKKFNCYDEVAVNAIKANY